MKTYKSYLFKKKEIVIKYPVITFHPKGYDHYNMWHFLGWLFVTALAVAVAALIGCVVWFWGNRLYMKASDRSPGKVLDARTEYVKACNGSWTKDGNWVPNVGSEDSKEWTCTKLN